MIRLVLFDIDGTLIRSGGAGEKAFGRVFASEFGIANGTARVNFAGRTDFGIVSEVLRRHHIEPSAENLQRFFDAYVFLLEHFLHQLNGGLPPGVTEWLRDLQTHPRHPVLGLLTGNIRLGAEIKLRHFGLWEVFQTGGFADDGIDRNHVAVAARKRGEALLGSKLRDEEVLVIGDTPLDISCGRHIGAKVLAVATGGFRQPLLQEHKPDWAVIDLRELTVADVCG